MCLFHWKIKVINQQPEWDHRQRRVGGESLLNEGLKLLKGGKRIFRMIWSFSFKSDMMEKCLKEKVCKERWDWQTWVFIVEARSWKALEDGSCSSLVKVLRQDLKLTLEVPPTAVVAATVVKIRRIIARRPTAIVASKQRGVKCYQELTDRTWCLGKRRILAKEQILRIY